MLQLMYINVHTKQVQTMQYLTGLGCIIILVKFNRNVGIAMKWIVMAFPMFQADKLHGNHCSVSLLETPLAVLKAQLEEEVS